MKPTIGYMSSDLDFMVYRRPVYDGMVVDACYDLTDARYDLTGADGALITICIWCGVVSDLP